MISRRKFNSVTAASVVSGLQLSSNNSQGQDASKDVTVGPMVGHVSSTTARLWYRPGKDGVYSLKVRDNSEVEIASARVRSKKENDHTVSWRFDKLQPDQLYHYSIEQEGVNQPIESGESCYFKTAPKDDAATNVVLAFGSCAQNKPLDLWKQIEDKGTQGLVLLGDTPYIDSTKISVQRKKHREFLSIPELANLIRHTPVWSTWDDHDFGKNDSNGNLPGKENSRQAFLEYRANDEYGHGDEGIYTSFRRGPVEVILLDTRWFSQTAQSPVAEDKPTLLGKQQWEWLKSTLRNSTAPFKIVACGMIWDDKENTESDDWGTYIHERNALFDFIGAEKISGVLLIGGDIHCSRLLRYKSEKRTGYPIYQCIVSPIHDGTIPSLNVPHPDLIHGASIPHVWLRVEVDSTVTPPTLVAQWEQMNGTKMWDLRLTANELKANE